MGTAIDLTGMPGSKGTQALNHFMKITGGKTRTDMENYMRAVGYSEYIINKSIPEINRPPANSTNKEIREWNKKQQKNKKTNEMTQGEINARNKKRLKELNKRK